MKFLPFSQTKLGSSLSLPAHPSSTAKLTTGQAGGLGHPLRQRSEARGQHLLLRRFLRPARQSLGVGGSKKRNSVAAEKRGAPHNSKLCAG